MKKLKLTFLQQVHFIDYNKTTSKYYWFRVTELGTENYYFGAEYVEHT